MGFTMMQAKLSCTCLLSLNRIRIQTWMHSLLWNTYFLWRHFRLFCFVASVIASFRDIILISLAINLMFESTLGQSASSAIELWCDVTFSNGSATHTSLLHSIVGDEQKLRFKKSPLLHQLLSLVSAPGTCFYYSSSLSSRQYKIIIHSIESIHLPKYPPFL